MGHMMFRRSNIVGNVIKDKPFGKMLLVILFGVIYEVRWTGDYTY
jgi:hypothetical protein